MDSERPTGEHYPQDVIRERLCKTMGPVVAQRCPWRVLTDNHALEQGPIRTFGSGLFFG